MTGTLPDLITWRLGWLIALTEPRTADAHAPGWHWSASSFWLG